MSIKLGNNIKALREYYGETQGELGEIIGVSIVTIQNWEQGYEIKPENREKIAYHFRVTEDDLENSDFTHLKKGDGAIVMSLAQSASVIQVMFPVYPKTDTEDDRFISVNKKHKKILNAVIELSPKLLKNELSTTEENTADNLISELFGSVFGAYADLIDESNDLYSTANLLSLLCIIGYCSAEFDMLSQYEELKNDNRFRGLEYNKKAIKNIVLRKNMKDKQSSDNNRLSAYEIETLSSIYDELVKNLRISAEWKEVAEYYIACKWICNLCGNGKNMDSNTSFGFELLYYYAELGNTYIKQKLIELEKCYK